MEFRTLNYDLSQGFIHHWLVAGPLVTEIPVQGFDSGEDWKATVFDRYYRAESGVERPVVDQHPLGALTSKNPTLLWGYYRCLEDHFIHIPARYPVPVHLASWAYVSFDIPEDVETNLQVYAAGPFDLWQDDQHLHRQPAGMDERIEKIVLPVRMGAGKVALLIRFEQVPGLQPFYGLALKFDPIPAAPVSIQLPTEIEPELLTLRGDLEADVQRAIHDKYVYGYLDGDRYNRNEPISLRFPDGQNRKGAIVSRLQSLSGNIFQERSILPEHPDTIELAKTFPLWNGPHHLALLPPAEAYYTKKIAFERKDLFYVVREPYSSSIPAGNFNQRAREALTAASDLRAGDLFTEIARMALKDWTKVNTKVLDEALLRIARCETGSIRELLGFLGALARYGGRKNILGEMRSRIHAALLSYPFIETHPGWDRLDYHSEAQQLLLETCALLAGQALPEETFPRVGHSGAALRDRAESRIVEWIVQRGKFGFEAWDSPLRIAEILVALSHLVDLADSVRIRELASILMDKIFFSLAVNSFQGTFGSASGEIDTASALSHRLSPLSAVSRLAWGWGNFNTHVAAPVSLACCKGYRIPATINKIARDQIPAVWTLEQHSGPQGNATQANKVTYKTADFSLSSIQDHYPGQPGEAELIWRATLGPDAVVFTNHPVHMSDSDTSRPNFWVGNGMLPRVAQWGDVLLALYHLPVSDWLAFSHAYFPVKVFDEYAIKSGWAFARVGAGYLALTASSDIILVENGPTAFRELRAYGHETIWLCHMGQALLDGTFDEFQEKILAMETKFNGLDISLKSLRGDHISFGWSRPFEVNEDEQPLQGFPHYENPYTRTELGSAQMDIIYDQEGLRLKFDE